MNPMTDENEADVQVVSVKLLEIYGVETLATHPNGVDENRWSPAIFKRVIANETWHHLSGRELIHSNTLLPKPPVHHPHYVFRFIDLFTGIDGIRHGFEAIGGQYVFTSEQNKHAVRICKVNNYCDPFQHRFNGDIRDITLSHHDEVNDQQVTEYIRQHVPEHDVLLTGFPYQPLSLAGISKRNALERTHSFACGTQGTLFFDVVHIINARRPAIFVLEDIKNLRSHDQGETFRIIMQTLDELGYDVADATDSGPGDPRIIDGQCFLPQHRERIVPIDFRHDLNLRLDFTLQDIVTRYPPQRTTLAELLEPTVDAKYVLTPVLWKHLYRYVKKHQAWDNGFDYGMVYPGNPDSVTHTLSIRYYKDGAEVLVDRGQGMALDGKDLDDPQDQRHRPHRPTPRECARLMGFEPPQGYQFRIPVSNTQAYRQFDNPVVALASTTVAGSLEPKVRQAIAIHGKESQRGGRSR